MMFLLTAVVFLVPDSPQEVLTYIFTILTFSHTIGLLILSGLLLARNEPSATQGTPEKELATMTFLRMLMYGLPAMAGFGPLLVREIFRHADWIQHPNDSFSLYLFSRILGILLMAAICALSLKTFLFRRFRAFGHPDPY